MSTIGERIKDARTSLKMSQAELARLLDKNQSAVTLWETNKTNPRPKEIEQIAKLLRVSPNFLMFGNEGGEARKKNTIRVQAVIGADNQLQPMENPESRFVEQPPVSGGLELRPTTSALIHGNSMWPVYHDGDVIFYNDEVTKRPEEVVGQECVVQLTDGSQYVKRVLNGSKPNLFTLASYNSPEIVDVGIDWCAPIIWIRKSLLPGS